MLFDDCELFSGATVKSNLTVRLCGQDGCHFFVGYCSRDFVVFVGVLVLYDLLRRCVSRYWLHVKRQRPDLTGFLLAATRMCDVGFARTPNKDNSFDELLRIFTEGLW